MLFIAKRTDTVMQLFIMNEWMKSEKKKNKFDDLLSCCSFFRDFILIEKGSTARWMR